MPKGVDREQNSNERIDYSAYYDAQTRRARRVRKKRVFTIVVICLLVVVAAILLLISPVFAIDKYEIDEMQHYESEEIIQVLSEVEGKNGILSVFRNTSFDDADGLLKLRLPDLEKKLIFNCPYLETAQVSFAFPNKLKVEVVERKPIFLTEYHNTYLYIDSKGVVIETFTKAECPAYPIIKGLEIDSYKIGCSIAETDDKKIFTAISLCNSLASQGIIENHIDIIDVSDYNNIWMFYAPSMSVKFGGSDNLDTKVMLLKEINARGYDGDSNGELDFTSGKYPIFNASDAAEDDSEAVESDDIGTDQNSADSDGESSEGEVNN